MTLSKGEQSFLEINKSMIEGLINKKIADFNYASAHGETVEDREKSRLLVLEFESYIGIIKELLNRTIPKQEDTGI